MVMVLVSGMIARGTGHSCASTLLATEQLLPLSFFRVLLSVFDVAHKQHLITILYALPCTQHRDMDMRQTLDALIKRHTTWVSVCGFHVHLSLHSCPQGT